MKTLELSKLEKINGGNSDDVECLVEGMLIGAGWGALFGGPVGALVGAWGAAASCLIRSENW